MRVACLTLPGRHRYMDIARAMCAGIQSCGDQAELCPADGDARPDFDCAVMYGWKRHNVLERFPNYVYADLGYWQRKTHYRLSVNGWSPHAYVHIGKTADRLNSVGVTVRPWGSGDQVLILGASRKSMEEHGFAYRTWETNMARSLRGVQNLVYRPKPTDPERRPIDGVAYCDRPIEEALRKAKVVVSHHSNACIDALVAGVPVYCETGAAAAFSVSFDEINEPPRKEGREQFLADVAWLQWSLDEMRAGAAWAHLRGYIK